MAFSAVYDACVLYPFEIRDVLMIAALTRCFTPFWTEGILDELARNLIKDGRATNENMTVLKTGMNTVFPYSNIPLSDFESLIPVMTNDPKDRHVLAAAVARKVDVIVTVNLRDFNVEALEPYGIEAQHPDVFVRHVLDLEAESFLVEFIKRNNQRREWAKRKGKQPRSDKEMAEHLARANTPMPETSKFLLTCLTRYS